MGNLKDELLRKGLADAKRARAVAHEEKARRSRLGDGAVAAEQLAAERDRATREQERRESDRRREQERQAAAAARSARAGVAQLLRERALTQGMRGNRRWHFVTRDRKIPFLELSDDAARRLENGLVAICEVPDSDPAAFVVVPADAAARVRESLADHVLFLNEGRPA